MDKHLYLERIGFEGQAQPDLRTLEALCRAHLWSVPFENFDIHLGVAIHLDEASLYRKIVKRRRGGFCYELNGLFAWLLREVGFEVDLLSARVIRKASVGSEFDHLALRVTCEGTSYLVDVGFGDGSTLPLPLFAGTARSSEHGGMHSLRARGDGLAYQVRAQDGATKAYQLSLEPRSIFDFRDACHYHQNSARSWFTKALICVLHSPSGTVSLIDGVLKTGGLTKMKVFHSGEYLMRLRQDFGIDLPRMPKNKSQSVEHRIRQQGLVWQQRAHRVIVLAGQLAEQLPHST